MDATQIDPELTRVLYTNDQIQARLAELAAEIDEEYRDKDLLLVGVLNGAVAVADAFSWSTST